VLASSTCVNLFLWSPRGGDVEMKIVTKKFSFVSIRVRNVSEVTTLAQLTNPSN
jgi:hypothetical protein